MGFDLDMLKNLKLPEGLHLDASLLNKLKKAKNAEELKKIAQDNGLDLALDKAKELFKNISVDDLKDKLGDMGDLKDKLGDMGDLKDKLGDVGGLLGKLKK